MDRRCARRQTVGPAPTTPLAVMLRFATVGPLFVRGARIQPPSSCRRLICGGGCPEPPPRRQSTATNEIF